MAKQVCTTQIEIKNADGLHMRPAMLFVDLANQFSCDIQVSNDQTSVDGKSIMQMTMLAAIHGTKLTIKAEGQNAQQAIDALKKLVDEELFRESEPPVSESYNDDTVNGRL